jgi:hypothetical protein
MVLTIAISLIVGAVIGAWLKTDRKVQERHDREMKRILDLLADLAPAIESLEANNNRLEQQLAKSITDLTVGEIRDILTTKPETT